MLTSRAPKCGAGASGSHQPTPVVKTPVIVSVVSLALRRQEPDAPGVDTVIQLASVTPYRSAVSGWM
jgi:hypothetical protein